MKVRHTACPQCLENGRDRHGDNLAVYPDGGQFCFSCGYHVNGRGYVVKKQQEIPTYDIGPMPTVVFNYLGQYLSAEEIHRHFLYDSRRNRAVLKDTLPKFYWGRDGHGGDLKVLTHGEVPFHVFGEHSDTLIIVEDPVSAIAASRCYQSVALFGSYLRPEWLKFITMLNPEHLVFWLDKDKEKEGLGLALRFRHLFNTTRLVTELDPKCYSTEVIAEFVENCKYS